MGTDQQNQNSEQTVKHTMQKRKDVTGIVVSNKMDKTVVVKVDRLVKHAFYKKYLIRSKKFKAHDEKNEYQVGDLVSLVESRPISKDKRWVVRKVIRKNAQIVVGDAL